MHKSQNATTSRQLCDSTTSSQHAVSTQVTDQVSTEQATNYSVLSKLVTAGARVRTCARAYAREENAGGGIISDDDLCTIRDSYVTYIGQQMTAMVAREIEDALKDGMTPSVVIDAVRITGDAPRPTPYYLRAVLRRWRRDRILTPDALAADRAAYDARKANAPGKAWWQNPALRYEQRPYDAAEANSLFTDLSAHRKENE